AYILEPLRKVSKYLPVIDSCRLLVETWAHCDTRPPEGDVSQVVDGAALFPRDMELAYRSALVCARGAHKEQALKLIGSALAFATTDSERQHLGALRAALAA